MTISYRVKHYKIPQLYHSCVFAPLPAFEGLLLTEEHCLFAKYSHTSCLKMRYENYCLISF